MTIEQYSRKVTRRLLGEDEKSGLSRGSSAAGVPGVLAPAADPSSPAEPPSCWREDPC